MKYVLLALMLVACSSAPKSDIPYCPDQRVSKEVKVTTFKVDQMNILREHTITIMTCVEKQ